jgi:16S rRNA (uracil1498-N3)-methyltransferase
VNGPAEAGAHAHLFTPSLDDSIAVDGPDGHHLQRVRRLAVGERVTAADGSGAWREYEVVESNAGRLRLGACAAARIATLPPVRVALAVALTKAGIDTIIASVTELGVARVTPVAADRSVVHWTDDKATRARERLQSLAREAAMQSWRTTIPEIDLPVAVAEIAARPSVVVADRGGGPAHTLTPPASGEWTVLVGPEGGFAPAERAALANAPILGIGPYVLRAVTAPVAAVSVLVDRIG